MKPGMRMMVIANREKERRDNDGYSVRSDFEGPVNVYYGGYNRAGDYGSNERRGREMGDRSRVGMDDMESRRRRDSKGRFRSEYDNMDSGYPNRPFPVYQRENDMNQIGFNANEVRTNYGMEAAYHHGDETEYRTGHKMGGAAYADTELTEDMATEWTDNMKNEDGTRGPHWNMEQVKQVMKQKGVSCDPLEMFVIMNALYSDYCAVFKKYNMNKSDVYVDLACAWLNDRDAVHNKAAAYYEHIVKK